MAQHHFELIELITLQPNICNGYIHHKVFLCQSQIGFIRCRAQSKMEAKVLDMCMGESLFKKTETSKKKSKKPKPILSNSPFKYKDYVAPIWELSKVSKNEIIEFDCRSTHKVKPPIQLDHKNDVLYQIFVETSSQDVKVMRIWLDMFVKVHEKSFEQRGKEYFRSKGFYGLV